MIAKAVAHADAGTFLLIAATILFVIDTIRVMLVKPWKPWMVPLGLACFSAAFWLVVIID
jgi:hypothetical protein